MSRTWHWCTLFYFAKVIGSELRKMTLNHCLTSFQVFLADTNLFCRIKSFLVYFLSRILEFPLFMSL